MSGWVLGNREQPVALAVVEASPPLSNTALSGLDGSFSLYGHMAGTYALEVTRGGFGALPPMEGVTAPSAVEPVFCLPPLDDRVADGGFEAGDLAAWQPAGEVAPTLTGTAHTGDHAVSFGGLVPPTPVTPTVPFTVTSVVTWSGGVLSSTAAWLEVPAGAVGGTVVFTLSGVPTVSGLPADLQDVGPHVAWAAALTDGTPLTATLQPVTLTLHYEDVAWQAARVVGEETLRVWWYDPVSMTWAALSSTLDMVGNTATVEMAEPGLFAVAGEPYGGPWCGVLEQEVALTPTMASGTLSLLFKVVGLESTSDTLEVLLVGPAQTVTYTLPLTGGGWMHRWWEVPAWPGPTATLRVVWTQWERERPAAVMVDEVSLGSAAVGSYPIYLPLVVRAMR